MTETQMLNMLKIDLGIVATDYDERLTALLQAAKTAIETEGITLDTEGDTVDADLVVRYAAWMWRKRDTAEGLPRMIRWQMNNKLFSQKLAEE